MAATPGTPSSLADLAARCGARLEGGEPARPITGAASLPAAQSSEVSFLVDPRYEASLESTQAAGVFVKADATFKAPAGTALLFCADPEMAFIQALETLYPPVHEVPGVDPRAFVEPGAVIAPTVYVGPGAVVRAGASLSEGVCVFASAYVGRNVTLGRESRIYPHAVLYDGVKLGARCIVHSGAVLGADGFGYKFRKGKHVKVPQVGTVVLGDDVEIGANVCVDRAALGETKIGTGSKIDNLVQVGHNNVLGQHVIVCGQSGIAGSCEIGDYAVLGAGVGLRDHVKVGAAAMIAARSGVSDDIPPQGKVMGYPGRPMKEFLRQNAAINKLPELLDRIRRLEKRLQDLEKGKPKPPVP